MTVYLFNKLPIDKKLSTLELRGVQVGFRKEAEFRVYLFQLDAFYVELFYPPYSIKLQKVQTFCSTSKLEPYLQKINLQQLLKGI